MDESGDVVWYLDTGDTTAYEVRRLANGNLVYIDRGDSAMKEIDLLGNVVRTWLSRKNPNYGTPENVAGTVATVATDTFHHDFRILPNGNFLVLSTALRKVLGTDNSGDGTGFPTSETNLTPRATDAWIVEDTVVEFNPDTGAVVTEWSLVDTTRNNAGETAEKVIVPALDPTRIGYDSLGGFWTSKYSADVTAAGGTPGIDGPYDWSHGNALDYVASYNAIIVSLRHQDAVIRFSRASHALVWILGEQSNWNTSSLDLTLDAGANTEWQYHQHSTTVTSAGTLMVFDNGNYRVTPTAAKLAASSNRSRAVEFETYIGTDYDAGIRLATQIWEFDPTVHLSPGDALYSPFICSVEEQPTTGNMLIDFGGISYDAGAGQYTDTIPNTKHWARILEVTHTATPTVVLDLQVGNSDGADLAGWIAYRARKLPSLYP